MCGIAGIYLKPNARMDAGTVERFADALLFGIDERGGDACGYAARGEDGAVVVQRASCAARTFVDERRELPQGTHVVLLHTRFATQGDASFPENNHPVDAGHVFAVHNGHIANDAELFRETGAPRVGRVDSEAIPMLVRHAGWDNAGSALERLHGACAVAMLNGETGALILARAYSSPLVVLDAPGFVVWASTEWAITRAWSQVLGTPPQRARFEYLHEGQLIRYDDGARRGERFEAYAPTYTTGQWFRSKLPVSRSLSIARAQAVSNGWYDDDEDEKLDVSNADVFARCSSCMDWYPERELFEVLTGCPVCPACEAWITDGDYGGASALPRVVVAPVDR